MTDWEARALVDDNRELKAEVERLQEQHEKDVDHALDLRGEMGTRDAEVERLQKRIAYQEQVIEQRNAEIARLWNLVQVLRAELVEIQTDFDADMEEGG